MKFPEQYRFIKPGHKYGSKPGDPFGAFHIPPSAAMGRALACIASDGDIGDGTDIKWEHVSVSVPGWKDKCPSWAEMSLVKSLFWDDAECVVQFHPPASEHINIHNGCLHLWREKTGRFPMPPSICV